MSNLESIPIHVANLAVTEEQCDIVHLLPLVDHCQKVVQFTDIECHPNGLQMYVNGLHLELSSQKERCVNVYTKTR
jgi:hypothetical protein